MADRNVLIRRGCDCVLVCLLVTLLAGADPPAQAEPLSAPTFTVNSTADVVASPPLANGVCETAFGNTICTLRAAIMKANHWPGGGASIILPALAAGLKYSLSIPPSGPDDEASGDLNISTTVALLGGGASQTIIDGNGSITNDRVFMIETGAVARLSGVTIEKGNPPGEGGGLYNRGRLALDSVEVFSNTANSPNLGGGGIYSIGPLTVTHSLIDGNRATNKDGGGIIALAGTVMLADSTIAGNRAAENGGGIENGVTLTVVRSTVTGNSAALWGGGLDNSGPATLLNSTVANNQADSDFNGSGTGGGIHNFNSPGDVVEIQNSLIANNFATLFVFNVGYIVWPDDCHGTLASLDYNLVSNTAGCTINGGTHDHTGVAANLGPLQDNGGPTWTHALLLGSLAIDAGNQVACLDHLGVPQTHDQRGYPRPAFAVTSYRCDIGAYEFQRILDLPLILK